MKPSSSYNNYEISFKLILVMTLQRPTFRHIEISQMICSANQVTGILMREKLGVDKLMLAKIPKLSQIFLL